MTDPLNIMLMVIILLGLAGTLLPSLPGTGIILVGALLHAVLTDFSPLAWQVLLVLILLCLAGYLGQYLITAVAGRKMGASKSGIVGACLGMLAGFILPIPGGIFAGAFIGAVAFEIIFDFKDLRLAMRSGAGSLIGVLLSLFFEFTVGLVMVGLISYRLFQSGP
ncbi:MAG: DUF456 domain-containing protein [Desulfobulbaceae bacterium]|nr:DUF456 domain-containing protein [Desulfobulbaceae bacterium]